ncbi:MAG: T9SS type A sorting domain-containing protein [candidate division WOR-3 bacterium]
MLVIFFLIGAQAYLFPFEDMPEKYWNRDYQITGSLYSRFDSLNVHFVGNWPFGYSCAVAYDSLRDLCYLGSGGGVFILDISDPSNPIEVSRIKTRGGGILGLVYLNNFLYLSDWTYGFEIWDVSNPSVPLRIGGCEILGGSFLGNGAWGLAVCPPYAYVVSKDSGLVVVDISNPTNPYEVARCYLFQQCTNVALSGNYAYVCHFSYGELAVIDITDPLNPTQIGGCSFMSPPVDVAILDTFAYVSSYCYSPTPNFAIVNIATPSNPVVVVQSQIASSNWGIYVKDTLVYLASRGNGLNIINVTDPLNPVLVGNYNTPGSAEDGFSFDTLALVADGDKGLRIISILNPSNPYELGFFDTPGYAFNSLINYPYLYLFDAYSGVYILNITDLHNPSEIGHFENSVSFSWNGFLQYPYLFVADGYYLRILDISVPSNPTQVSACSTYYARDVAIKDTFAFIACGSGGLTVVNIANTSNPYVVATDTTGEARAIVVNGDYAYTVGYINPGFWVYDITNPLSPYQIGYYNSGTSYSLAIKDTFAFIGTSNGLTILNIVNPSNPTFISSYSTNGTIYGLSVKGSYAVLSSSEWTCGYIKIIDISAINNPLEVGFYTTPYSPQGIEVLDTLIFVSNSSNGIQVYASSLLPGIEERGRQGDLETGRLEVYPNPFTNHCIIKFRTNLESQSSNEDVGQGFRLAIKIYDVSGRLIEQFNNPSEKIIWNGRDEYGRKVAPGVYFLRVDISDTKQTFTHKLIKLE